MMGIRTFYKLLRMEHQAAGDHLFVDWGADNGIGMKKCSW